MKRKANPVRFRKRQRANAPCHDPRSAVLRGLHDLVQRRQYAQALSQIDQAVAQTADMDYKSRLLALACDCLFKQGKFAEAADAYAAVGRLVSGRPLNWLRPAVGEIRSLLKNVQVGDAQVRATAAVQQALAFEQEYEAQVAQAQATVAAGGQAVIPAQPPRASVVATRLGRLFFHEGELATAKSLFQLALEMNPSGACAARLGLAEIALRENDPTTAIQRAREALAVGQYRAKTLPAWDILLAAGRRTGTDTLDAALLNGLAQAPPSVRARAVLLLAKGLRSQGDARWAQIANNWLQSAAADNPTIAAELRKLRFAHARVLLAPLAEQRQAAQALLQTPNLSPTEWLAGAKELVRTSLLLNQTPPIGTLLQQGANRFGSGRLAALRHGLALACQKAKRSDLALPLLQANVANASGEVLGKSLWALARLQAEQGDHASGAQTYWTYSQNAAMPQRHRLYALLQWTREIMAANQPDLVARARPQIEAALPRITDYELVLDLARQVFYSNLGRDFALQVFQRGQQLGLQTFDNCPHPAPAATILFKLCRRANDLALHDAMIATWARLNEAKRQWLWSEKDEYWQWLEHVFRAYRDSHRGQEAEQFVTPFLSDPATPPQGYAILGVSWAAMKRERGDLAAMFRIYEEMTRRAPTHEWTSVAYYWLALRAWKSGQPEQTRALAERMLQALGHDRGLFWKQDLAASALCLAAGLDVARVTPQAGIGPERLRARLEAIAADLRRLPG